MHKVLCIKHITVAQLIQDRELIYLFLHQVLHISLINPILLTHLVFQIEYVSILVVLIEGDENTDVEEYVGDGADGVDGGAGFHYLD